MSTENEQILAEMKQELADVELSIEQSADQGDVPMVEYYDEKRNFLTNEIKHLEAAINGSNS